MKKISSFTAALVAAAGLILAPVAEAAPVASPSSASAKTVETSPVQDESEPALTFYVGAMGDMLNCGGYIGRLWCKK